MPSLTVDRPSRKQRDDLWSVIADYPNIADWNSGVVASHATSESTAGVGATRHCDLSSGGTLEETVRAWDDRQSMTISVDDATKVPFTKALATFRIADSGEGHSLIMEADYSMKGGPLGAILGHLLKPTLKKNYRAVLDEWEAAA